VELYKRLLWSYALMLIDNLPEISFVDKDPLAVETELLNNWQALENTAAATENRQPRTLGAADPLRTVFKTITLAAVSLLQAIDHTGKQNLLAYAIEDNLEHKGIDLAVGRNEAKAATVTVRFTLSTIRESVVNIPAGTMVTAGNEIFFSVRDTAQILPGNLSIDCVCECLTAGEAGNGYLPGEIVTLVNPIGFVDPLAVANIDTSAGGIEVESDDSYRERIRTAPEKFTTAGSWDSYKFWARSATQNIIDVSVYRPEAGYVNVVLLMTGGTLPSDPERALVSEVLNAEKIRPGTDEVQVLAPEVISYEVELTYYIRSSDAISVTTIQNKINTAISDFILWQKSKIGRDINPTQLIAAIHNAGAKRVELTLPVTTTIENNQIAIADMDNIAIVYGGLEGD